MYARAYIANCCGGVAYQYGVWYWNSIVSGAARPVPPIRNSDRAFTDRHTTTHSAIPVATAIAADPTAHTDWLPPPNRSWW